MSIQYANTIIEKLESVACDLGGGRIHDLRVIRAAIIIYRDLVADDPNNVTLQKQLDLAAEDGKNFLISIVRR